MYGLYGVAVESGRSRDRGRKQFESSLGDEVFSDPPAEGFRCCGVGGFGVDLNDSLSIRRDDLGEHAPLPCFGSRRDAVSADGQRAAAAEHVEGGALGFDGESGVGVLEEGDGVADVRVPGFGDWMRATAGFKGEGSLTGSRTDLFGREAVVDGLGALEAVEAGGGKHESVALSVSQFFEASVDVASYFYESDVRAEGEDLRAAARAGGTDTAAGGKGVKRPVLFADPDVAGVGSPRDRGEGEL